MLGWEIGIDKNTFQSTLLHEERQQAVYLSANITAISIHAPT